MAGIKLQKREHDFFVSYGHADRTRVAPWVELLTTKSGLKVWFDKVDGNAAARSSELLSGAIGNTRGALFCLSESWTASTWCKNEYEVALNEQRAHEGFEIIAVRLDDVEAPPWFQVAQIVDLRDAGGFARLLSSLSSELPHRYDNSQDVYLAASWSRPSAATKAVLPTLKSVGWRLVGDSMSSKQLPVERIRAIMQTTRGIAALLQHEPSQSPYGASPYILEEAKIAADCGKPLLLLAEPGVSLPEGLAKKAFRGGALPLQAGADARAALTATLAEFDEELQHQPLDDSQAYIFYAASLRGELQEAADLASVIQRASNMQCARGERLAGTNVQAGIVDLIKRAAVVVADVSDDHRNTLIEAGVAMGAGTPLKLMAREPETGPLKKRFMFEGQEYFWYRTPEERLALCYYFARQYRRRVYVVR